jgi:TRAP-type C4-dicarboxylate transport system permease small subunit
MKFLSSMIRSMERIEQALVVFLVLAIVAMVGVQVVSRYFFNQPMAWVEELSTYCFIWTVFVGASIALKQDRHIAITALELCLSDAQKRWLKLLIWISVLTFMLIMIPHGYKVMQVEARSNSVSLPVDIPRMWFYSLPLTLACISMLITSLMGVCQSFTYAINGNSPLVTDTKPDNLV